MRSTEWRKEVSIGVSGNGHQNRLSFINHLTDDDSPNYRKIASQATMDILEEMQVMDEPTRVSLVAKSIRELGLKAGCEYEAVLQAAAEKFGLKKCHGEVGPELAYQYVNQPKGEWLLVASDPLMLEFNGKPAPHLFSVGCGYGGKQIFAVPLSLHREWDEEVEFVFTFSERPFSPQRL